MARLSQNLRRNIIGCPTSSIPPLSGMIKPGTQPKITNFNFHLIIQKHIAQLHISMYNTMPMQILHSLYQLQQVVLGLKLSYPHSIPQKFYIKL